MFKLLWWAAGMFISLGAVILIAGWYREKRAIDSMSEQDRAIYRLLKYLKPR